MVVGAGSAIANRFYSLTLVGRVRNLERLLCLQVPTMEKESMSTMTIRRERRYSDMARSYTVLLDGESAGDVGHGETLTVAVMPGEHTVKLAIDWCGSPEVTVRVGAGETLPLDCGNNSSAIGLLLYITIWRGRYLWLRAARPSTH